MKSWIMFFLLIWTGWLFTPHSTEAACTDGVCVSAGSRLASLDTQQSALLNPLLSSLLGTNVNLTALDWNGLAGANVNLLSLLNVLQTDLALSSPEQVLDTNITLLQLVQAIKTQQTENTAITALDKLLLALSPLTPTIQLGDLLQTDPEHPQLTDVNLGVLPLLNGAVQLFNLHNVLTTPTPITIDASLLTALGLPNTLPAVKLYAQVVEPPIYRCGPAGSSFHTTQIRLKLDLDLSQTNVLTDTLNSAVASALGIVGVNVTSNLALDSVSLYVETARADGVIQSVDYVTGQVKINVTPSVASLYLGHIPNSLFFNRSHVIDPATDVITSAIGNLTLQAKLGLINVLNLNTEVRIRSVAEGTAPLQQLLVFDHPYPQTQTAGSSTAFVAALLDSLMNNLTLEIDGISLVTPVLNAITSTLTSLVTGTLSPLLDSLAQQLLDPLLSLLGIGIGEAEVTVWSAPTACDPPEPDPPVPANLSLTKSVWNVSRNMNGNQALPGETLRYEIRYRNNGQAPLKALAIHDSVPEFTQLLFGSMDCPTTPSELPACQITVSGQTLSWSWPETSTLQTNSEGMVSFQVTVD